MTGRIDVQEAWADPATAPRATRPSRPCRVASGGTVGATPSASASRPAPGARVGLRRLQPRRHRDRGRRTPAHLGRRRGRGAPRAGPAHHRPATSEKTDDAAHPARRAVEGGPAGRQRRRPGGRRQWSCSPPVVAQAVQGATPVPHAEPADPTRAGWHGAASSTPPRRARCVVGPAPPRRRVGSLTAVRAESQLAGSLSTVDTGSTPMGDVTTGSRSRAAAGQRGTTASATAKTPLPACAAAAPGADAARRRAAGGQQGRRPRRALPAAAVAHLRGAAAGAAWRASPPRRARRVRPGRPPGGRGALGRGRTTGASRSPCSRVRPSPPGACAPSAVAPGLPRRLRSPALVAVAGAAAFGLVDDLARTPRRQQGPAGAPRRRWPGASSPPAASRSLGIGADRPGRRHARARAAHAGRVTCCRAAALVAARPTCSTSSTCARAARSRRAAAARRCASRPGRPAPPSRPGRAPRLALLPDGPGRARHARRRRRQRGRRAARHSPSSPAPGRAGRAAAARRRRRAHRSPARRSASPG